jgi:hypothetical protein
LIQESGRFEEITVRQILQRPASVARRSTRTFAQARRFALDVRRDIRHPQGAASARHECEAAALPRERIPRAPRGCTAGDVRIRKAGLADDMKLQFIGYSADIIGSRIR